MLRPPRRKARLCAARSQLATTGLRYMMAQKTKRPDWSRGALFYGTYSTMVVMHLSRQNL